MSRKIKIIHAADLHLDSPFDAREDASARRSHQRELLYKLVRLSKEHGAELLLLAGDLLDSQSAYTQTARAIFEALSEAPCPVFISPGNHDFYSLSSPYAKLELPDNVHIFTSRTMECVFLPEISVRVWGAAFTGAHSAGLLNNFSVSKQAGVLDIAVLHGDTENPSSAYNPISASEIEQSGLDYLALGHIHTRSAVKKLGRTHFAYPGCLEGRGFDECGEKGALLLEISEEGMESKFLPVSSRRYACVRASIEKPLSEQLDGHDGEILKLTLVGRCSEKPNISAIHAIHSPRFESLIIEDKTTLSPSIWQGMDEVTLRGIFLKKMHDKWLSAQTDAERGRISSAVRWGLAALDGGEAVDSL